MINKKSVIGNMDANVVLIVMYILAIILYLLPGARYFAWGIPLIVYLFENKNIDVLNIEGMVQLLLNQQLSYGLNMRQLILLVRYIYFYYK